MLYPLLTLAIATSSSLLPLPFPCTSSGGALHYFSGSHFRVWRGRPRRAESGVYFEGGRRVHRGRVQWRACSRNWLHGTQCPPRKIGRVKLGQSGKFDTISSGSSAIPPVRRWRESVGCVAGFEIECETRNCCDCTCPLGGEFFLFSRRMRILVKGGGGGGGGGRGEGGGGETVAWLGV